MRQIPPRMPSSTVENYLKAILHLRDEGGDGTVTVGEVARELEITPGTVTIMMRHLHERGLIDYTPRRGLRLLPSGEAEALQVVRRHRLIELFLTEIMQLDWSEVHEEAEILEHVVSDRLLARMDEMLGHPTHDPHGDPIPDRSGRVATVQAAPLADMADGAYRVVRVSDEDSALLGWLQAKGITLGQEFELSQRDRAAGIVEINRRGGESVTLALAVAEHVFVEALD